MADGKPVLQRPLRPALHPHPPHQRHTLIGCLLACSPTEPTIELADTAVDSRGNAAVLGSGAQASMQAEEQASEGLFNAAARSLYMNALANASPEEQASGGGGAWVPTSKAEGAALSCCWHRPLDAAVGSL